MIQMRIFRKLKKCANSRTDAQKTQALICRQTKLRYLYVYAETEHMHFYHKDKKHIHRIGKIFIVLFGIFIIAHSQNFCKTKKLKTRYKLTNRPVFGRLVLKYL